MPVSSAHAAESAPALLVSSSFTTTPLEPVLAFWRDVLGRELLVEFVAYQQLFQSLLQPGSPLLRNRRGANVVLWRMEDLGPPDRAELLEQNAADLTAALEKAAAGAAVPFLAAICPSAEDAAHRPLLDVRRRRAEQRLRAAPNVHVIEAERVVSRYEVSEVHDPVADRAGHIPYRPQFFAALGTALIRAYDGLNRRPLKVLALDCDNTLWSGVCGEDGPEGVIMDPGRLALARCLLAQREAGVLLALTSKNNEQDVRDTFAAHPEWPLAWSHFSACRINWEPKSKSLLELAGELGLGLDSVALLEDDPRECAEVRRECPEVQVVQLPQRSGDLPRFLEHLWLLDQTGPATAEDRARAERYAQQIERSRFEQQARDFEDFIAGLQLQLAFAPVTRDTAARVAQLTQRTNQMNTSLERWSEPELRTALEGGGLEAFTVTLADRFGSYGLVGSVLFRTLAREGTLEVAALLLSCRALGRGVEHRMLAHAAQIALARGLQSVRIPFTHGPRNSPAIQLLGEAARRLLQTELAADARSVVFPAGQLADFAWPAPGHPPTAAPVEAPSPAASSPVEPRVDYERIARRYSTAAAIQAAADERKAPLTQASSAMEGAQPESELERQLAAIWTALLGRQVIHIEEDFFEAGGHSLLAVQLLSHIHREVGVELPDSVIYGERLSIRDLARAVEMQQLGIADREAYEAALAEVAALSDEEVAALLAADGDRERG